MRSALSRTGLGKCSVRTWWAGRLDLLGLMSIPLESLQSRFMYDLCSNEQEKAEGQAHSLTRLVEYINLQSGLVLVHIQTSTLKERTQPPLNQGKSSWWELIYQHSSLFLCRTVKEPKGIAE